ncbi:anti-sigma B factor RsbW [Salisediminibacterium beveridgei]|uniref:Serine-protein kinase RsbW n=1 Tax=Salisediminibacterium beveridgei TaxID=632773 RepID=A0A1D7QYQ1_9BACI|nr:anti-sigma B factor RsbW [Salisediminibacterium beveridgei]AOM84130.1 Serine-protein kinase rsbW [Salisediminibacterium beveridgei]
MSKVADCIEMSVPAKAEYVGVVRLTASGVANRLGYSYDDIEDIKLAVAEACNNVVNHAYSQDGTTEGRNDIHLEFTVYDDRVQLIVADRGGAVDLDFLKKKRGPLNASQAIEDLKEGGLGLFLIETLMDEVDIQGNEGVVIVMTKFLKRVEVEPGDDRTSQEIPKQ